MKPDGSGKSGTKSEAVNVKEVLGFFEWKNTILCYLWDELAVRKVVSCVDLDSESLVH